jgi:hypothetical protein
MACSEPYGAEAPIEDAPIEKECTPSDCDCDEDGFNDLDKPGCESAGGDKDCDDTEPRARPNQDWIDTAPASAGNGDWNCNGKLEKRFKTGESCASGLSIGCAGREGFRENPACGEEGAYVVCKSLAGLCEVDEETTRRQACK